MVKFLVRYCDVFTQHCLNGQFVCFSLYLTILHEQMQKATLCVLCLQRHISVSYQFQYGTVEGKGVCICVCQTYKALLLFYDLVDFSKISIRK